MFTKLEANWFVGYLDSEMPGARMRYPVPKDGRAGTGETQCNDAVLESGRSHAM